MTYELKLHVYDKKTVDGEIFTASIPQRVYKQDVNPFERAYQDAELIRRAWLQALNKDRETKDEYLITIESLVKR